MKLKLEFAVMIMKLNIIINTMLWWSCSC